MATTEELIAAGDIPALDALSLALEAGAPAERLTLSSDAGGSLPLYRDGELAGLQSASPGAMLDTLTAAIGRADTVETVIAAMTRNPARALGLARKGCIAPGFDADLMLLDSSSGSLDFVMCQGQWLLKS